MEYRSSSAGAGSVAQRSEMHGACHGCALRAPPTKGLTGGFLEMTPFGRAVLPVFSAILTARGRALDR